ncbi:nitroreductase family protein [Actinosynnema sp. CS-041913]|uniref:nitroreductase family protein n=1 Tax=Actinosynnema sp. CS-041913 TaxID=3239917 RepID=UPI003D8ABBA7
MDPESAGEAYHRLTVYRPDRPWFVPEDDERVLSAFEPMDDSRYPAEFKRYPDALPRVVLPTDLSPPAPLRAGPVDLVELSRLLYFSAGVVRYRVPDGGRPVYFRAAPSAGNLHPVELYVCARDVDGLDDGVWHYSPRDHALVGIGPPPVCDAPAIVLTGVPWRTCWKYAERGYRHLWWDAGTVVAQLHALRGDGVHVRLGFADREIARLVGADPAHEFPLAVVDLGRSGSTPRAAADAVTGDLGPIPVTFPLIGDTHRAGDLRTSDDAEQWAETPVDSPTPPRGGTEAVEEVILRRGSTRRFDPKATIPLDAFRATMLAAGRVPPWDSGTWPLASHVVVNAVDGLSPGVYRWHDAGGPEPVADGDSRAHARSLCCGQDLAYDSAFLVLHSARVGPYLGRRGERGYRVLQFAAGLASGALYLSAFGRRLGCTGLTIADTTVPAVLRSPTDGLLATAVGVPAYRSRPGATRPGSPTRLGVR